MGWLGSPRAGGASTRSPADLHPPLSSHAGRPLTTPGLGWVPAPLFSKHLSSSKHRALQGRTDEPEQLLIGLSLFFGVEDLHY